MISADLTTVKATVKNNKNRKWDQARVRLVEECEPVNRKGFTITPGSTVFTIGSCFARNIEEHIARLGCKVPTLNFSVPRTEWVGRPNGILNKYTPPSIFQEINWAKGIFERDDAITQQDCAIFCYDIGNGKVIDNNLGEFSPVTYERFIERRFQIYEIVKSVFSCDCMVITLGLIEAWLDTKRNIFIHETPLISGALSKIIGDDVIFKRLTFTECRSFIQNTIDAVRSLNPRVKILITTSPVPFGSTFTEDDVIVANMQSKSVLRAVAGEIADDNEGINYFPSYERVMLTRDWSAFHSDLMHVTDEFVAKIVLGLARDYFPEAVEGIKQLAAQVEASRGSENVHAYLQKAAVAVERGALYEARGHLHDGVQAHSENSELNAMLGKVELELKDFGAASAALEKCLSLTPNHGEACYNLARVRSTQGRLDEAAELADRAAALIPIKVDPWALLGSIHMMRKDWNAAGAAFEKALAINGNAGGVCLQLSMCYTQQNRPYDALQLAERASELLPARLDAHLHLGRLYLANKDQKKAEEAFAKVTAVEPENAEVKRLLTQTSSWKRIFAKG